MFETELDYEAALTHPDKRAVREVDARQASSLDRLEELPHLTSLRLSGNKRIQDFSVLTRVPGLERLYLADLGLTQIPTPVASLERLTTLYLGKNPIKDFASLASLPALVDLGLEEMGLKKIPDQVLRIGRLEVLGLYGNQLTSIASVTKLRALRALYVAGNNLKKLPDELQALASLRLLDIMQNYALEGWGVLESLEQLEALSMTNAHELKQIPSGIFRLPNLKRLTISIHWNAPADTLEGLAACDRLLGLEQLTIQGASLTRLPEAMRSLRRLRTLDLKRNPKLTDIDALEGLTALEELDLSKCDVLAVRPPFSTLTALKRLDLSHNDHLAELSGLRDLPALEKLTLYSELRSLPRTLGSLPQLKVLELSASADDLSFLAHLVNLEELYIAGCTFETLPSELAKLKKLTIIRPSRTGDDAYLAAFHDLEELAVTQPSFELPVLPRLRRLSVGRIEASLELSNLRAMPQLEHLALHRSKTIAEVPASIAEAQGLRTILLEFLDGLKDLSSIRDLPGLRELSVRNCKRLVALPGELATLTGLERLALEETEALTELSVIGELSSLTSFGLRGLKHVETLPPSLAKLGRLERVRLNRLEKLRDISVLEQIPNLVELACDGCEEVSSKALARVLNAITARSSTTAKLAMSYQQFIEGGHYKALVGKADLTQTYAFPLAFDLPEALLAEMENFSWLDDHRDEEGTPGAAILNDPDSPLKPLAILDFSYEGCDPSSIDSYAEEIFLVDTVNDRNPVFVWGHDRSSPHQIHSTFDDFLAHLRDFREREDPAPGGPGKRLVYLELVDARSSKFWQIEVEGSRHEVRYGKIGKPGTPKVTEFADDAKASADADRQIKAKLAKGYLEKAR